MSNATFLSYCRTLPWYKDQLVHWEDIPHRDARYQELARPVAPQLENRLREKGLYPLYTHQASAVNAARGGENVIVATPAASGKSLCYNLPVLDAILERKDSRALYIYPTKALSQDQLRHLKELVDPETGISCHIYDGDTPVEDRDTVRRSSTIVLTNPDMLHLGILPNHRAWRAFLQGLRYIVVDEAHVYRGVFGSHVANLIRRLLRLCHHYGSRPRFILGTATIGNPQEHAQRLTGLPCKIASEDGAPYGGKDFLFWNPPLIDQAKATRRSATTEAAFLFSELLKQGVRTLAFVRTRKLAELVSLYVKEQLSQSHPDLVSRVSPYRASYLPEDRRRIEADLARGALLGVSTTNALELGIDIGDLDATILTGYPGSIASTWQQAGRSGRRGERSLSIFVGQDNPLDQYLMHHPEAFFQKLQEHALLSPQNPYILQAHLLCAAYEMPLSTRDEALFGEGFQGATQELANQGLLHQFKSLWYLQPGVAYPAQGVNLRSTSPESYTVVEEGLGRVLEKVESRAVPYQLHPGAVYLHQGETYLITRLDPVARNAWASLEHLTYYTQSTDVTDLRILDRLQEKRCGHSQVYLGKVDVSNQVTGFKKKAQLTEEVLAEEPLDLPPQSFPTVALWFDIPEKTLQEVSRKRLDLAAGLHAAEHAAIGLLPLFAMCDRNDIGGVSTPLHPDTGRPQVFIYDSHPGGVGIAEKGYELIQELWEATLKLLQECPCQEGCPGCIQSPKCGNNNRPLDKAAAAVIFETLLGVAHSLSKL